MRLDLESELAATSPRKPTQSMLVRQATEGQAMAGRSFALGALVLRAPAWSPWARLRVVARVQQQQRHVRWRGAYDARNAHLTLNLGCA